VTEFKKGDVIGSMTVLERLPPGDVYGVRYRVRCACGERSIKSATRLRAGLRRGRMQCKACYCAKPAWTWADLNRRRSAQNRAEP
jgi:hypothetical protein